MPDKQGYRIVIRGTVQGVGFRPYVYRMAVKEGLRGEVYNDTQGVVIRLFADRATCQRFITTLQANLPPLAKIEGVDLSADPDAKGFTAFTIRSSGRYGDTATDIPPDTAMCEACEAELFDPTNRRYRYPFISCMHCGPRFSIVYDLPYDRERTSMRFFPMCARCEAEYRDPSDRRYHAQPIGCWECGPKLSLWRGDEKIALPQHAIIEHTAKLLQEGHIVAVKGIGGYHLMCDATDDEAVARLRLRKRRPHKPFAVMVATLKQARTLASIDETESKLLRSPQRPIVLCRRKTGSGISDKVAPDIGYVGLFLPYTPVHALLMQALKRPLVATSANLSDEPICTDRDCMRRLQGVYDYLLEHDRIIINGCDDSVVTVVEGQTVMLRRARGYTPQSIRVPFALSSKVLALGAHQKSTVAIGSGKRIVVSPHIGDLNGIESMRYYEKQIETLCRIYDFKPHTVICDKHPGYASTRYAHKRWNALPTRSVQHHHAHILGVMAEKGLQDKVFGVAFDGTGYGDDGALWGGEWMVCDRFGFKRVAHVRYVKLLGGEKAIKQPRRMGLSWLFECYGKDTFAMDNPCVRSFTHAELQTLFIAWQKGLNAPKSSSVGRLFDAVASLLGVCQEMSFEGQSGLMLEAFYDGTVRGSYPFVYRDGIVDMAPMIEALLKESDKAQAVSRFFHTVVEAVDTVYREYRSLPLVLSGGVFQNRVLLGLMLRRFPDAVIANRFPPNDGGIALGQAIYEAN